MGCMGLRLKGNNLCFLTDLQFVQCLAILFGLFNLSVCLFEDQIGKFDWKQNYVGQIKFAHFDTVSTAKKIILATEENVVAALNFKSGQILWRQVLERAQQGRIQFLHVDSEIVTVSGQSPWLIRTWEPTTGRLLWEWSLTLTTPVRSRSVYWFLSDDQLVQLVAGQGSLEVTSYNVYTGQNKGGTSRITAPWVTDLSRCVITGKFFACTSGSDSYSQLYYINILVEDNKVRSYPIQTLIGAVSGEVTIDPLKGNTPGIIFTRNNVQRIVLFEADEPKILPHNIPATSSLYTIEYINDKILLKTSKVEQSIVVSAINLESGKEVSDLTSNIDLPFEDAELFAGLCAVRRDGGTVCRYLLATEDQSIHFSQNTAVRSAPLWSREEALAHIVAVELLDLPVSDLDASIETEFDTKEENLANTWDCLGMIGRRLSSQAKQLKLLLFTVLGGRKPEHQTGLVRDEFGLHKMIIAVTSVGKIYGIDNLNGKIIWKKYLENIEPFSVNNKESMLLYVQRTTRHLPWSPQCLLISRDKQTKKGVIYMFDPMTGAPVDEGLTRTNYLVQQAMIFPRLTDEFLRPVLILDDKLEIHVVPSSTQLTSEVASQMYLYTANAESGELRGYSISVEPKLGVLPTWTLRLGLNNQRIRAVVPKSSQERVHAQGRVLPDRSVLYKYVNPNLVAVLTHGPDATHRFIANVYLVDAVSGAVLGSISHKRAKDPFHIVHSENWLAYSYFNDKWRRTEVGTVELYEGQAQSNATAFSSLAPPPPPLLERQAYILAAQPVASAVTFTEKGITSKHVLLALSSGGVMEMPWLLLDPRRPTTMPTAEMREEGVIPYIPELPLPHEAIINYNQTLQRVRGIHTAPSGLESTCLVLVHGLDIFYTRVAPSKTFDLLKDDFDYYLIVIVLSALLLASYVTKHLASRKALRQAWK